MRYAQVMSDHVMQFKLKQHCISVFIAISSIVCSEAANARTLVDVSTNYSAIDHSQTKRLLRGESVFIGLNQPKELPDRYHAAVRVKGGAIRVIAFDGRDIEANHLKPSYLMDQRLGSMARLNLPIVPTKAGVGVWFVNPNPDAVDVSVTIFRTGQRSPEVAAGVQQLLEGTIRAIEASYELPQFKVSVRPCGTANAFSAPDIVICTELIADLVSKDLTYAIIPILLHEVGHTLLTLWGLPGHNNEDMVDDFAAAFLAAESPETLGDLIKWLDARDSGEEAILQLVQGGRHTLSIQRARNLRETLKQPEKVMRRWARLLAPYKRR